MDLLGFFIVWMDSEIISWDSCWYYFIARVAFSFSFLFSSFLSLSLSLSLFFLVVCWYSCLLLLVSFVGRVYSSARYGDCKRREKIREKRPGPVSPMYWPRTRIGPGLTQRINQFPLSFSLFFLKSTENKTKFDGQIEILIGSNEPFHYVSSSRRRYVNSFL